MKGPLQRENVANSFEHDLIDAVAMSLGFFLVAGELKPVCSGAVWKLNTYNRKRCKCLSGVADEHEENISVRKTENETQSNDKE